MHTILSNTMYRGADKSLARPGRKQANVSVRMAWISFGVLPCRCCWNRARPSYASELDSVLVRLRTYQHPGITVSYNAKCLDRKRSPWSVLYKTLKTRSKMLQFARSDVDRFRSKRVALKEIIKCCVFMQFGGHKEMDTIKFERG